MGLTGSWHQLLRLPQSWPQAPVSPGAGTGTLQPLQLVVPLRLPALGSRAAAHSSGWEVAGGLSHGLRREGVPTQKADRKNVREITSSSK